MDETCPVSTGGRGGGAPAEEDLQRLRRERLGLGAVRDGVVFGARGCRQVNRCLRDQQRELRRDRRLLAAAAQVMLGGWAGAAAGQDGRRPVARAGCATIG